MNGNEADFWSAVILGAVQGFVEWLPVSSQGSVAAVRAFLLETTLAEAAAFAIWVQIGTTFSALYVYRKDVRGMVAELFSRELLSRKVRFSPLLTFLVLATATSVLIGLPLYLLLEGVAGVAGGFAMIAIGALMLVTGALQLRRRTAGERGRADLSLRDAILAGVSQGFAVLPGLSRSGLTMAALLSRRIHRQEALNLSFLMSIPASLGAALFVGIRSGLATSGEALLAAGVAAVVGLVTIRGLLAIAGRLNFGIFVICVAVLLMASGLWQVMLV